MMTVRRKISSLLPDTAKAMTEAALDPEVTGLCCDSRRVEAGHAFFALPGVQSDGRRFIADALQRGARAVVAEQPVDLPDGIAGFVVPNGREAMAHAAALFYDDPTAGLPVVGVTGTNGKTTVTYLLESLLTAAGFSPAVLGTINYRFGGTCLPAPHTTPESTDLMATLAQFRQEGADSLIMEVSSHALAQHRADGVHFTVGVFTNLTSEHLDYHGDMASYFASKKRLFNLLPEAKGRAVVNIDDPYGQQLAEEIRGVLTCGRREGAAVTPESVTLTLDGIHGRIRTPAGTFELHSGLLGEFNLENLLCAVAAGIALDLPVEIIEKGIRQAPGVPGRLERIENNKGAVILVDYAHTGDALDKVLSTVCRLKPRRVLVVFGCGGDRDKSKRPAMAAVAIRHADLAIITTDNPRSEDPATIIDEIEAGCRKAGGRSLSRDELGGMDKGYFIEHDRRRAIELAVSLLQPGDLLLVAGKGHEDYQIIGSERLHFDDREQLRRSLAEQEVSE